MVLSGLLQNVTDINLALSERCRPATLRVTSGCLAIDMDLLQDWLAPTIQRELSQALQWKEDGPNAPQLAAGEAGYSDDGSNLRVQSSKKGVVQISKVRLTSMSLPVQYSISNSS